MSSRPSLPLPSAGTMLPAVLGLGFHSVWRQALRVGGVGLASLALLLTSGSAGAQAADDSGWFDPPPDSGVPDPYYVEPASEAAAPEPEPVADTDPSALTTFKPVLDPYGRWVSDPNYGTVWVPHSEAVGPDFAPYVSRGHWSLTADDDWIWVSDYPFGWAVFHYGRWVWISGYGWSWVPGRTYANAWVVWRVPSAGYAYVGWAPMPPSWVWMNGAAVTLWYSPPLPFVFCPSGYLFHYHVHSYIVHDHHLVRRIAPHTRIYPTPYHRPHRPARPSTHVAAAPPRVSAAPRGPRLAAARVPSAAVPAQRTAPPAPALRLSGTRRVPSSPGARDVWFHRTPSRAPTTVERWSPEVRAPATSAPVRRTAPIPQRDPRAVPAPSRTPAPSRARTPARVRLAPERLAPTRSRPAPVRAPARDFVAPPGRTRSVRHR